MTLVAEVIPVIPVVSVQAVLVVALTVDQAVQVPQDLQEDSDNK